MISFVEKLRKHLHGEVFEDQITRTIYSVDASIYEVKPSFVVIPRTTEDILITLEIASEANIPITPRGAGTGLVGGCIGPGVIIDTSKYLSRILSVDTESKRAICEPGVIQNILNKRVEHAGLRLGPNTSTGNRATIGGMIGNNSGGSHSLRYGQMADCVEELEIITSCGETLTLSNLDKEDWHHLRQQPGATGRIHRKLYEIRDQYGDAIREEFPHLPRQVSGYNLDRLVAGVPYNPSSIIVGSEGTLGIVTKATLSLAEKPHFVGLVVLHLNSLKEAFTSVPEILKHDPTALELIDHKIISIGRDAPSMAGALSWLQGNPQALLIIEFDGSTADELKSKLLHAKNTFSQSGYHQALITDKKSMDHVWRLRKSGLGLLLSRRSFTRAIAFIEDVAVPVEHLPEAVDELIHYLDEKGKEAGIYGHIGVGALHIRPWCNTRDPKDLALMKQIMLDVASIIKRYQGSLSAEHGDGLCRSWLNKSMFGPKLYKAFKELKTAFDPKNLMNPGKIVDGPSFTENLRSDPETPKIQIDTFLDWKKEGGFSLAADLCNGNGQCRKTDGVMCPSFQASRDEWCSTRARAQALRSVVNGRQPLNAMTEESLYDVLDLCLQCKGCKTQCPSQVDMAKMKSEFLYHYRKNRAIPIRDRLFGHLASLVAPLSPFPNLGNKLLKASKPILTRIGISPQRNLPEIAAISFYSWWKQHQQASSKEKCVLFIDTFTAFFTPNIGIAAVKVLNALGYEVIIPKRVCCGRPLISKGMLPAAKKKAEKLTKTLAPFANIPIIGLEPSCTLTIRDDFPSLFPEAENLSRNILTFQEFIYQHRNQLKFKKTEQHYKIHGHCYEKALMGMDKTEAVFSSLPGSTFEILPSGCCGMAGSFGYESEHYVFSLRVGETTLFPHLRNLSSNSSIISNGTSCRQQIHHTLGVTPLPMAEVLASRL